MTFPNKKDWYTANQPLCFGGQIYMWNRYQAVGNLVHMPDAQFTKGGHQNRINLLTPDGKPQMVVIPLKDRYLKPINECELHDWPHTAKKLRGTLDALYSRFDAYKKLRDEFFSTLGVVDTIVPGRFTLDILNIELWDWVAHILHLDVEDYVSDAIVPIRPEHPSEWVAKMGFAIDCKHYLGGETAQAAYLRKEDFESRGMKFFAQKFKMKPYRRTSNSTNEDAMICILDPLFVGGPDLVWEVIGGPAY